MLPPNNIDFRPPKIDTWGYLKKGWDIYANAVSTQARKLPPPLLLAASTVAAGICAKVFLQAAKEEQRKPEAERDWSLIAAETTLGLLAAAGAGFCLALTVGLVYESIFPPS